MRAAGLVPLNPSHLPEALRVLREDPVPNVFLLYLARRTGLRPSRSGLTFFGHADLRGRLQGVGAFGPTLLAWSPGQETAGLLGAEALRRQPQWRAILGDRRFVDPLWRTVQPHIDPPAEDRLEMWLSVSPADFTPPSRNRSSRSPVLNLRPAAEADVPRVLPLRCAMFEEPEGRVLLSYERERIRRRCRESSREGNLFLMEHGRRVVFTAAFSAVTPEVTQISSVYTVPEHRGEGIATKALAKLCALAFEMSERISLFVAAENLPARRVYEKLGFHLTTTARSIQLSKSV